MDVGANITIGNGSDSDIEISGSEEDNNSGLVRSVQASSRGTTRQHRRGSRRRGRSREVNRHVTDDDLLWNDQATDIVIQPFTCDSGPRVSLPHSAFEIFRLFFTTAVLDLIVTQTNKYASQCLQNNSWVTYEDEILAYMGFCILMGIHKLPDLYDYWSTDDALHSF